MRRIGRTTYSLILIFASFALFSVARSPALAEDYVGEGEGWLRVVQDDLGNLHLVNAITWDGSFYRKYDGSSWIGPTSLPSSTPCWFPFTLPDVAVGPDGRPQVVYGVNTGEWPNDLAFFYYAKANDVDGTSWSVQTIGNDGFRRNHTRIAVDENDDPHIVYVRTNESEPFWWQIIYRRPDGSEKIIDWGNANNRVNNPCIAYQDGIVHIAYYKGGSGTMTTDIWHASDSPDGVFPLDQVSNMPYMWFVGTPDIAIDPNGGHHIIYFVQNWTTSPPVYQGVHINGEEVDGGTAWIDESYEDLPPSITFTPSGDRVIAWSRNTNNETIYRINDDPNVVLTPSGCIDVCGGSAGAYYVRTHDDGIYLEHILPGGPDFFPPTAIIDNIIPDPVRRGFHSNVTFLGTAYDNDEGGESIVAWEWTSNREGVIGSSEDFSLAPIDLRPGNHWISFRVMDNEQDWSATQSRQLQVLADSVPPPPVTELSTQLDGSETIVLEWIQVTDNLAMDRYDLYRAADAWFTPDVPIAQIHEDQSQSYEDGDALSGEDETAFYLVVPVDIDGNSNIDGARAGGFRYSMEISP